MYTLSVECFDRDELRLRERPMLTTSTSRESAPNYCVLWLIGGQYLEFCSPRPSLKLLFATTDQVKMFQRLYSGKITIRNWLLFCLTRVKERWRFVEFVVSQNAPRLSLVLGSLRDCSVTCIHWAECTVPKYTVLSLQK